MANIVKCDKCHITKKKKDEWLDISIHLPFQYDNYDLCPKCAKPFLAYAKKFFKK